MNTNHALAMTLLMTASAVMAQPFAALSGAGAPNDKMKGAFLDIQWLGLTPPIEAAGREWASPTCTHMPCALKDKPSWNQKALEKAMAEQKALTPNAKFLDLGDGRFAMDFGNGTASINTINSSGIPRPITPELKEKFTVQAAKDTMGKAKQADDSRLAKSTPFAVPNTPVSGYNVGVDLSDGVRALGDPGTSRSGGASGDLAGTGNHEVIMVDGAVAKAEASKNGYTYTRIAAAAKNSEDLIRGAAATFNDRANPSRRAAPNE